MRKLCSAVRMRRPYITPPYLCTGSRQGLTNVIALDCEMVGVGPGGERSALAR